MIESAEYEMCGFFREGFHACGLAPCDNFFVPPLMGLQIRLLGLEF